MERIKKRQSLSQPPTQAVTLAPTQEAGTEEKVGMSYTNLADSASIEEVRSHLQVIQIPKDSVDRFLAAVNEYNELDKTLALGEGFIEAPLEEPDYNMVEWPMDRAYFDANCRITAYALMKEVISGNPMESDDFTFYDAEVLNNNPWYEISKEEQAIYFGVFDAVTVEPTTDSAVVQEAFLNAWKERNVTFAEGNLSLISVICHSELDNTAYIGHCGVLAEGTDGLLFIEKYAPNMPYQVTRFKNRTDLSAYLMNRFGNFYTEGVSAKPVLLENNNPYPL